MLGRETLELSLTSSKTDPFCQGVTITVANADDSDCPVASMRWLLQRFPSSNSSPLFNVGNGFTRQYVNNALKESLGNLGYSGNYAGHSFRRGAATWAKEAGLTDQEIQLLGRWRLDSYRLYIDTNPSQILNASKRLQR